MLEYMVLSLECEMCLLCVNIDKFVIIKKKKNVFGNIFKSILLWIN